MDKGRTRNKQPADLKRCAEFHGHVCPGLIYGYRVAKEAARLMKLKRSKDEEVVTISENDSCAVDALQVLLGTSAGKGNLIIQDFGKNAYTVLNRSTRRAYRFSRKSLYEYGGKNKKLFSRLEKAVAAKAATAEDRQKLKSMKMEDLLTRPFGEIFTTAEVPFVEPYYARLEQSLPCAVCGEMTMATKLSPLAGKGYVCIPCSQNNDNKNHTAARRTAARKHIGKNYGRD